MNFNHSILYLLAQSYRCCLVLLATLMMVACTTGLTPEAYREWVKSPENGLRVRKEANGILLDWQYQPVDLMLLNRGLRGGEAVTDSLRRDMAVVQYYQLTLRTKDGAEILPRFGTSVEEKQRTQYYFSYLLERDVVLEEQEQKLPCVLYHFDKSGSDNTTLTCLLGFENLFPASESSTVIINSPYISSLPIKFTIFKNNIPSLKL